MERPWKYSHSASIAAWSLCEYRRSAFSACTVKETFAARRRHRCNRREGGSSCTSRQWSSSRRGASPGEPTTGCCAMQEKAQSDGKEAPRTKGSGPAGRLRNGAASSLQRMRVHQIEVNFFTRIGPDIATTTTRRKTMTQEKRTMTEMMMRRFLRRAVGGSCRAREALRTKEIRAQSRCASAGLQQSPQGLCWGSRHTECKEAGG